MRGRNRSLLGAALLLVAALCLVPLGASAQQAPPPGTMVLDIVIDAGVTELRPGPLTVPNPQGPNPFYEGLQRAEPVTMVLPVQVEDAPDGLYVEAFDLRPLRVIGWAPGIGQQSWKPLEYLAQIVDANTGLPVQLQGSATPAPPVTGTEGILVLPLSLPAPGQLPQGVPARPPAVAEALPLTLVEGEDAPDGAQPYQPALPRPSGERLAEAGALTAPLPNDSQVAFAAVLAAGAALLALKLLLPLYHRFKRKTALDNPTRQRLYELLRVAPGASAAELSEGSGLHVTTVKYHLDVLRRVGMVGEQSVDGCRRFYSYENGDRLEFLTRALLDEPAAKAIYRQIENHPGLPFIEVSRALGMRKEHVHYHVKKLAKHGLLTDRWEGGRRLLFVAPPGAVAQMASQPHAPPAPARRPVAFASPPLAPAPAPMPPEVRA